MPQNGLELLAEIVEIYDNYDWKTEVLAASIRHPIHVIEAARIIIVEITKLARLIRLRRYALSA